MMRIIHKAAVRLAFAAVLAFPAVLAAQEAPPRPNLPRGADANDWEAYFELGDRMFKRNPQQSAAAFYWASRLDPSRAEPLFARWAAYYGNDMGSWMGYLSEDEEILRRPAVIANDSLLLWAYRRNPFVHRGLEVALYALLGERLRWGDATIGFMSYGEGDFGRAADQFGRLIRGNPGGHVRFRHWRALAFVGAGQVDSAAAEISELLRVLRAADAQRLAYYYESKALYEYALGLLHEAQNRPAEARRAFERALEEDLTMYPARSGLARLSLRERKAAEAVEHLAQAVEIAPEDALMHFEYANALMSANRRDEAIPRYQQAIAMEPHYADPYLRLAVALQNAGQREGALAAYRAYLERAPRRQAQDIRRATERVAELQAGGS
jgi:tetratricopeptide (TPR) repeat protein